MKTIYDIFIISVIGVLLFAGVNSINEYMFLKGDLDSESENLVIQYDNTISTLMTKYNTTYDELYENQTNLLEVETDVNTLDAFVKEYGEAKQKIGLLRQGMNMITNIPDMILLSVPFIDEDDLIIYKRALFIIIIFVIGIAIINALFNRRVSTNP